MIKVKGVFKEHEYGVLLTLHLPKDYFEYTIEHINNNMFISYKRVADKFKKILIISIGDHLDNHNIQNVPKADICIDVTVEVPSTEMIKALEKDNSWYIHLFCAKESYLFAIDKETEFIRTRLKYESPDKGTLRTDTEGSK